VDVSATVTYAGGGRIPDSLAAMLAGNCLVTARAAGAQVMGPRCMRYDRRSHEFRYRWRPAASGRVSLTVGLAWPSPVSLAERFVVVAG
jgi:hypothetical protein